MEDGVILGSIFYSSDQVSFVDILRCYNNIISKKNTQLYFVMWRLHPVHVSTRVFALNE